MPPNCGILHYGEESMFGLQPGGLWHHLTHAVGGYLFMIVHLSAVQDQHKNEVQEIQ